MLKKTALFLKDGFPYLMMAHIHGTSFPAAVSPPIIRSIKDSPQPFRWQWKHILGISPAAGRCGIGGLRSSPPIRPDSKSRSTGARWTCELKLHEMPIHWLRVPRVWVQVHQGNSRGIYCCQDCCQDWYFLLAPKVLLDYLRPITYYCCWGVGMKWLHFTI